MSAFVVDPVHIDAILSVAVNGPSDGRRPARAALDRSLPRRADGRLRPRSDRPGDRRRRGPRAPGRAPARIRPKGLERRCSGVRPTSSNAPGDRPERDRRPGRWRRRSCGRRDSASRRPCSGRDDRCRRATCTGSTRRRAGDGSRHARGDRPAGTGRRPSSPRCGRGWRPVLSTGSLASGPARSP